MSASLGQRLVITRSSPRPDQEADSVPVYTKVDLARGPIPPRVERPPLPRHPRRQEGRGRTGRRGGHLPPADLHPPGDHLPVPLAGPRPRPFLPRRGRAPDPLAGDQRPQALRPGDRQLLRRAPEAPARGRRPPGPSNRPRGRGRAPESWTWKG